MAAARLVLAALLLAVAASSAFAAAPAGRNGRVLLQSGVSCPAQIPACTARRCTTRILDSKETYVCLRCQRGYVPVKGSDGKSVVQCGKCKISWHSLLLYCFSAMLQYTCCPTYSASRTEVNHPILVKL
jgi:hypothetical protein